MQNPRELAKFAVNFNLQYLLNYAVEQVHFLELLVLRMETRPVKTQKKYCAKNYFGQFLLIPLFYRRYAQRHISKAYCSALTLFLVCRYLRYVAVWIPDLVRIARVVTKL